jgi:hypothetical protein
MIGRERGVLIRRLFRRFDHWLLLRAPILWRTRLLHCLLLLCLLILAKSPFVQTSISLPSGILPGNIILTTCWLQVSGVVVVLGLWVRSILRKPVGEIALRRHVVTVVAVGVGSYLWLVTPSLFAYVEINAIKGVDLSDRELQADVEFLGLYKGWDCIPPSVWKDEREFQRKLEQLHEVLDRYVGYKFDLKTEPSPSYISCDQQGSLAISSYYISSSKEKTTAIQDARRFWVQDNSPNQFSSIRKSFSWFIAIALGFGVLTAIFSYPTYVWGRTFSVAASRLRTYRL